MRATDDHRASFTRSLDAIEPGLAGSLASVPTLEPARAERVVAFLLETACCGQHVGPIQLARAALQQIPRQWLAERIGAVAEQVLDLDDEWVYRRLLELLVLIDDAALRRLVERGLRSDDPDLREAAQDFQAGGEPRAEREAS